MTLTSNTLFPAPSTPVSTATSTGSAQAGQLLSLNATGAVDQTALAPNGLFVAGPTVVDRTGLGARHYSSYPAIQSDPTQYSVFQVSQTYPNGSYIGDTADFYQWGDNGKGHYFSFVKSRGNGILNDPGYYKQSLPGDRLCNLAFYGSNNANAAHAGYFSVVSAGTGTNNELPSMIFCKTSNALGPGNGWSINAMSQMWVPGPNITSQVSTNPVDASNNPVNNGANFVVGPGAATPNGAPMKLTPGPLLTVPEPYAEELGLDGKRYYTDSTGKRLPYHRATQIIAAGATKVSHTGDTAYCSAATFTLPANSLGPNGWLEWSILFSGTPSTNSKIARISYNNGLSNIAKATLSDATLSSYEFLGRCSNRGATNSQVFQSNRINGAVTASSATTSIDTTVDVVFSIDITTGSTTETVSLESFVVKAIYAG